MSTNPGREVPSAPRASRPRAREAPSTRLETRREAKEEAPHPRILQGQGPSLVHAPTLTSQAGKAHARAGEESEWS